MSYVVVRPSGRQLKFNYIDTARAIQGLQEGSVIYHFEDGSKLPYNWKRTQIIEGEWYDAEEHISGDRRDDNIN